MHGYPEDLDPAWTHILHQEVLFPKIWGPVQKKSILLGFHNAWWRNPLPKKIHAQASESGTYPSMGWGLIKKVEIGYKHLKLLNPAIPPLNRTTRKHRLTQYCIAKIRDIGCSICQILIDTIFYRYQYFAKFAYRYRYRYRYFQEWPCQYRYRYRSFSNCPYRYRYRYQYFQNFLINIDTDIDIFKISLSISIFSKTVSIYHWYFKKSWYINISS